MTDTSWLRYSVFVTGLLTCAGSYGQVVSAFTGWEQYKSGNINQGPDGPCEYITRTWAVEYAVRMYYKDASTANSLPNVDLSEQHLWQGCLSSLPEYSQCPSSTGGITSVCVADFIANQGIANEACLPGAASGHPYDRTLLDNTSYDVCRDPCVEVSQINRYRFKAPLQYAYQASELGIHNNEDLKKAIIKYGPQSLYVQEGLNWPYSFRANDHAILIVGWTSSGKWRFQNSSTKYFNGIGVSGIGELAFDIRNFSSIKVGRVNGLPECEGYACSDFAPRDLDHDGDGFCSIKWGDLPAGISCTGHDANDNSQNIGPYNAYGYPATVITSGYAGQIVLDKPIPEPAPFIIRASDKIILKPGFIGSALSGDRGYKLYIDKSL